MKITERAIYLTTILLMILFHINTVRNFTSHYEGLEKLFDIVKKNCGLIKDDVFTHCEHGKCEVVR